MLPNSNFIIKEEDHPQQSNHQKQPQVKPTQFQMAQLYPPPLPRYQIDPFSDNQLKKHPNQHSLGSQSQPFMNLNFQEGSQKIHHNYEDPINPYLMDGYFEPNYMLRKPWYGGNYCEDYYWMRVKQESMDDMRFQQGQLKDDESRLFPNELPYQNFQVKQEQFYNYRFHAEDVNKYIGPYLGKKQDKKTYRRMKVERFLQKKKLRSFQKKITYHCRKEVAENRIRYKGRFISLKQAIEILGLKSDHHYPAEQLKKRLQKMEGEQVKEGKTKEGKVENEKEEVDDNKC